MKKFVQAINYISEISGQLAKYMLIALVMVLCYEVISRYVFNNPTIWVLETAKMLLGTLAILGFAYTYLYDEHVRVDVLYIKFSRRGKAWINVIMSVISLFPFIFVLNLAAIKRSIFSWKWGETLIETSWQPPALPMRIMVAIGLILFALQSISKFIQELYFLMRKKDLLL